ncbi:cohesin domain-containing protein [Patescibacteria group bacterium]|nr:cohesin domain-containing protein [Patescibacteria group bacterium]
MSRVFLRIIGIVVFVSLFVPQALIAASITVDASTLVPNVGVSFSPRSGSFEEGATFQIPVVLDTNGTSINGIEVRLNFDSDRLSIVQASTGQSIIGVWVEPPAYDNTRGTASYVGVVPNGIVTDSGVIGTITFRAKATGRAVITVRSDSNILLNDGLGSPATLEKGRAEYQIIPKAPGGVSVYSETHPSQTTWYNNNSPVIAWDTDPGVTGFSYVLDNKPNTVPGNTVTSVEATKGFENLKDGLWYFHIKAFKNGVWGGTTHFLVRVDTTPPARFKPQVNYVLAAALLVNRTLVSFFTTDNLSGVDRYEVGVIDKSAPPTESPAFVEAESPFQVSASNSPAGVTVIVRALDRAGNVRDESIDVRPPSNIAEFLTDNVWFILLGILIIILIGFLVRLFFGEHILTHVRRVLSVIRAEHAEAEKREALKDLAELEKEEQAGKK